ncbi:MAG: hypothetical protein QOE86_2679 [Solirubrobacteraceae bacterium]|jgi:hypothetical protein|nr:hypothetical protein [Solirubrobacteraceae bacterium]
MTYDPCARCAAPLDDRQRYCVVCGESARRPDDPVTRYLRDGGRRLRPAAAAAAAPAGRPPRADSRLVAVVLALLPLAAAGGVLAGRGGSGSDSALLAAVKAQDARLARASAAAPATTGSTTSPASAPGAPTSDFTGADGFVVRLRVLPAGTDAAGAAAAKLAARRAGAANAGVLVTRGLRLKPAVAAPYLVYAGPYPTRAAAAAARKRLAKRFPQATVVQVRRPATGRTSRAGGIAAADAVIRKHPTAQQKADGAKIVQQIQAKKGKSYVQQQQQLPDTIVVP